MKLLIHSPVSASQTHTRLSLPAEATYFPSLLSASARTSSVWPGSDASGTALPFPLTSGRILNIVFCFAPFFRSHLMIEPSLPAV